MDNEQYYASLDAVDGKIANTVGFREATKCKLPVVDPEELASIQANTTDVDETLQKLKKNDASLEIINLNNIKNIPLATLKDYASSISSSTHVTELHMVGTRSNDSIALELAESLKANTKLRVLNLETNYLSLKGISGILTAINESGNTSLQELKIENQRQNIGPGGEQVFADLLEENQTLQKFSYQFKFPGPRQKAVAALTRNCDVRRQKRKK